MNANDYQTAIADMEKIDLDKRKSLGKDRKLRTVTIWYKVGQETKKVYQQNLTGAEVLELRNTIYSAGLMLPVEPGKWLVVSPWDIVQMVIERQERYFN